MIDKTTSVVDKGLSLIKWIVAGVLLTVVLLFSVGCTFTSLSGSAGDIEGNVKTLSGSAETSLWVGKDRVTIKVAEPKGD